MKLQCRKATGPRMKADKSFLRTMEVRLTKIINIVGMTVPFAVVWYIFYADKLWVTFQMRGHWLVILLFLVLYSLIGRVYNAFSVSHEGKGEMIYSQFLSYFETDSLMYIAAWLLIRRLPQLYPMLLVLAVQALFSLLWILCVRRWYYRVFPPNKTVIVWSMRQELPSLIDEYNLTGKYRVVASVSVEDCIADLHVLDNSDTVFLAGIHSHDRNIIAKYCMMHGIRLMLIPRVGDLLLAGAKRSNMFHLLMLSVEPFTPSLEYMVLKRLGDLLLSLIGLIVTAPLLLVTAICIKMEDGGPVFYTQRRLTKGGRVFMIYKFRSMRPDAEADGVARLSTGENDERITRVGRVMRKFRIDELPQLINVIKGDLSLVGPRAERPEIAAEYEKTLPEFSLRLQVKAGLTGFAQVSGKYNTSPYDKLLMDLMYIANAGVLEDIRILFLTLKVLFSAKSTEGVAPGSTTAMNASPSDSTEDGSAA